MLPKHLGQECRPEVFSPQTTQDLSTIEVAGSDALTGGGTCGKLLRPGVLFTKILYPNLKNLS